MNLVNLVYCGSTHQYQVLGSTPTRSTASQGRRTVEVQYLQRNSYRLTRVGWEYKTNQRDPHQTEGSFNIEMRVLGDGECNDLL